MDIADGDVEIATDKIKMTIVSLDITAEKKVSPMSKWISLLKKKVRPFAYRKSLLTRKYCHFHTTDITLFGSFPLPGLKFPHVSKKTPQILFPILGV